MPLGRDVGLGPGDIVLDVDPAPRPKEAQPSIFRPTYIVANIRGPKIGGLKK